MFYIANSKLEKEPTPRNSFHTQNENCEPHVCRL